MKDSLELFILMGRAYLMRLVGIFLSDNAINKILYRLKLNEKPNFDNPQTFSEKLQVLKMHYINPLMAVCVDKYYVSKYVELCGYSDILKEVYAVYTDPDQIDLSILPEKFFLQMNHMSKFNYIMDKRDLKRLNHIKKVFKVLKHYNHYWILREKAYKNIAPRIICCEYLEEPDKKHLTDYKFYCFDGEVKYFMISYGEFEHNARNAKFDLNWNNLDKDFKDKTILTDEEIKKPKNFERMVEIATTLSRNFPHVRVDLYNIEGKIYFGEMTFFSSGGFVNIKSDKLNKTIGSWIDLVKYKKDLNI